MRELAPVTTFFHAAYRNACVRGREAIDEDPAGFQTSTDALRASQALGPQAAAQAKAAWFEGVFGLLIGITSLTVVQRFLRCDVRYSR